MKEWKTKKVPRRRLPLLLGLVLCCILVLITGHMISNLIGNRKNQYVDGHKLFESLLKYVVIAGTQVVKVRNRGSSVEVIDISKYTDGSAELHTVADSISHQTLSKVKALFPKIPFVDEEDSSSADILFNKVMKSGKGGKISPSFSEGLINSAELSIYVDPLDATQEFSEGLTEYVSISACIARCGRPLVGIVYLPFQDRIYWTRPGTDVHVNFDLETAVEAERAINDLWTLPQNLDEHCCARDYSAQNSYSVSESLVSPAWNSGVRVVGSRSHSGNNSVAFTTVKDVAEKAGFQPPEFIPAGGAGYKIVQLLEGKADLYLHNNPIRKWDLCAGEALLRSANGVITDWAGQDIDYCVRSNVAFTENREETRKKEFTVHGVISSSDPSLHSDIVVRAKPLN